MTIEPIIISYSLAFHESSFAFADLGFLHGFFMNYNSNHRNPRNMSGESNEIIDLTASPPEESDTMTLRNNRHVNRTLTRNRRRRNATDTIYRLPRRRHPNPFRMAVRHISRHHADDMDNFQSHLALFLELHRQQGINGNSGLDRATINNLNTARVGEEEYTEVIDLTASSVVSDNSSVIDLTKDVEVSFKPLYTVIKEKKKDPALKLDEPCTICLENFKEKDECIILKCKHTFHKSCVRNWLLQRNSCPLCRSPAS